MTSQTLYFCFLAVLWEGEGVGLQGGGFGGRGVTEVAWMMRMLKGAPDPTVE